MKTKDLVKVRIKHSIIILISIAVCIVFGGFFVVKLLQMSKDDNQSKGSSNSGGMRTISSANQKNDTTLIDTFLVNITSSKTNEAIADIQKIKNNENIPEEIKDYFNSFKDYYNFIQEEKRIAEMNLIERNIDKFKKELDSITNNDEGKTYQTDNKNPTSLNTDTFIKNSEYIRQYYGGNNEDAITKSSYVPYCFIKIYNAVLGTQKEQRGIYKSYIDFFVTGRTLFDKQAANVLCLYVYASYDAAKTTTDFSNLKSEIEKFLNEHKNELGENGDMSIQRGYLTNANEILRLKPDSKAWFGKDRLKPYPASNL